VIVCALGALLLAGSQKDSSCPHRFAIVIVATFQKRSGSSAQQLDRVVFFVPVFDRECSLAGILAQDRREHALADCDRRLDTHGHGATLHDSVIGTISSRAPKGTDGAVPLARQIRIIAAISSQRIKLARISSSNSRSLRLSLSLKHGLAANIPVTIRFQAPDVD